MLVITSTLSWSLILILFLPGLTALSLPPWWCQVVFVCVAFISRSLLGNMTKKNVQWIRCNEWCISCAYHGTENDMWMYKRLYDSFIMCTCPVGMWQDSHLPKEVIPAVQNENTLSKCIIYTKVMKMLQSFCCDKSLNCLLAVRFLL